MSSNFSAAAFNFAKAKIAANEPAAGASCLDLVLSIALRSLGPPGLSSIDYCGYLGIFMVSLGTLGASS